MLASPHISLPNPHRAIHLLAIAGVFLVLFAAIAAASAAPFVPVRDPSVVAYAPSGNVVATGCNGQSDGNFPPRPHPDVRKCGVVALWDVATGKRIRRMETYGDLTKLAFSHDGRFVAACRLYASGDGVRLDEVRIWDVTTGRVAQVLDRCHAFDFSPTDASIVVLSRSRAVVYDLDTWEKQHTFDNLEGALTIEYSADGKSLVTSVEAEDRWQLQKFAIDRPDDVVKGPALPTPMYQIAISPTEALLATGHAPGLVILWNSDSLEPMSKVETLEQGVAHPFFSHDGKLLGIGSQSRGDVQIVRTSGGEKLRQFTFEKGGLKTTSTRRDEELVRPESDPTRFVFSPSGEAFLTGAYGGIVRLIDSGADIRRFGD